MDLLLGILGGALQLLVSVHVVLLGELQVLQEFGVHLKDKKVEQIVEKGVDQSGLAKLI